MFTVGTVHKQSTIEDHVDKYQQKTYDMNTNGIQKDMNMYA